jgi:hypothetical protein
MLDDKEKVREVYGFSEDDPDFPKFYYALEMLADGRRNIAEFSFLQLTKGFPVLTPAIYKYAIVAMLENGALPEDLIEYADAWVRSARARGMDKDEAESAFMHEAFTTIKEHPEQRDTIMQEKFGLKIPRDYNAAQT